MAKLELNLQASYYLASILLILHSLALIAVTIAAIPWFIKILLIMSLLGSLIYHISHYILALTRHSIRQVVLTAEGEWWLKWQGEYHPAELLPYRYHSQWLILLNFKLTGKLSYKPVTIILLPDSLTEDDFRHLNVRLSFG